MLLLHVLTSVVLAAGVEPDAATLASSAAEQVSAASALAVSPAAAFQASPRFTYGNGSQGFGYYQNRQAAARPRTVGPGARNWATGNRVPLARPWMNAR